MYKINFPVPDDIAQRALEISEKIKSCEKKKACAKDLIQIIYELTEHGLEIFFIRPVKEGKFNILLRNMIFLSIKTTLKTMKPVISQVVKKLPEAQIEYLANFIEEIIRIEK